MTRSGKTGTGARHHFRTIALVVGAAVFMEQMDGTVLATALPGMARDLGVSAPSHSVALTTYLNSLAIFIPASGWLADRLGGRGLFRGAILFFTASSLLCALAPNVPVLAAARFLQGMGGAIMIPVARLLLFRNVEKRDMVSALSWLLVPALLGPIAGPPVGGLIVTFFNWRWIFFLNLPVGPGRRRAGDALFRRYAGREGHALRPARHDPLRPVAGHAAVRAGDGQPSRPARGRGLADRLRTGDGLALSAPCTGDGEPDPRSPPDAGEFLPHLAAGRSPSPASPRGRSLSCCR